MLMEYGKHVNLLNDLFYFSLNSLRLDFDSIDTFEVHIPAAVKYFQKNFYRINRC